MYQDYDEYTHDSTYATAIDKGPPDIDPDADPIVESVSRTSATNKDNGVHRWTAPSRVKCYSDEYKELGGLIHIPLIKFKIAMATCL